MSQHPSLLATAPTGNGRLARVLAAELPTPTLVLIALALGLAWSASLLDWRFVIGTHPYWQSAAEFDQVGVLVAYAYYVREPWGLPLFDVASLAAPAGSNIIFVSGIPIVALIGKITYGLTGVVINPFGGFLFLCFALPGVAMTLLLRAAGLRSVAAMLVAVVFADTTPAILFRLSHFELTAQFLLILALALYVVSSRRREWTSMVAWWTALIVLSYLTSIYMTMMVATVWACATVQRWIDGRATLLSCLAGALPTLAIVVLVAAMSGQFGKAAELPFSKAYGFYSMNLLSPVTPYRSGFIAGWGGIADGTGGQHEGFNYLGLGLIAAGVLLLPSILIWLRGAARRHAALLAALLGLTLFALSHRIYLGSTLLVEAPLPTYLVYGLGIFRASGRFFWIVAFALMATVLVVGLRRRTAAATLMLVAAAILQFIDVLPTRALMIANIAAQHAPVLGGKAFEPTIAGASRVFVAPSVQCLPFDAVVRLTAINMEVALAASTLDIPINTYLSGRRSFGMKMSDVLASPSTAAQRLEERKIAFCEAEIEHARTGGVTGEKIVLLTDRPRQDELAPGVTCTAAAVVRVCSREPR